MPTRSDNQYRRNGLEARLDSYLEKASSSGELPMVNGRLCRADIRAAIGCGDNWLNQNKRARKTLMEWDNKLHAEGLSCEPRSTPGQRDPSSDQLKKQIDSLQRRNAQLMAEVSDLKQRLSEFEWISRASGSDSSERLPW